MFIGVLPSFLPVARATGRVSLQAADFNGDHDLHDLPAARLYVTGLRNAAGQSCFANAALQMLAASSQLMGADVKHVLMKQNGLPREFMELLQGINSIKTERSSQSAVGLLNTLAKTHAQMDGHSQQDSHEALTLLLDTIIRDVSHGSEGVKAVASAVKHRAGNVHQF